MLVINFAVQFKCYLIVTGALENPIPIPLMSALEDRNTHILNNEQEGKLLHCTNSNIKSFVKF